MKNNGFTLIELIIAIGLSALFLPALIFVFSFSLGSAGQGENYTKAYSLAQEQMEAIYYIKQNDENWEWAEFSPVNTNDGEYYQLQNNGNSWELGNITSNPQENADGYTLSVEIHPVYRDVNGNIIESGFLDSLSREITVNVEWKENGFPTSINLVSYVSRH